MLCGCISTSIACAGILNSQCASMTSSALFIIVAESTETLRPIDQLGCAQASAGDIGKRCRIAREERPAGCGQNNLLRFSVRCQTLINRVVFAINRQQYGVMTADRV